MTQDVSQTMLVAALTTPLLAVSDATPHVAQVQGGAGGGYGARYE